MKEFRDLKYLDLRGIPCPINFVRCTLALEDLNNDELLKVRLDKGEPVETVVPSLIQAGYDIRIVEENQDWIICMVQSVDK